MLRNYAIAYLGVGHGLTKSHHMLFETELVDPTTTTIDANHERHKEALKALSYAEYACKQLPVGTLLKEIKRAQEEYKDGCVIDRLKTELMRLYKRFEDELQERRFLYVAPEYEQYYGNKYAFGPLTMKVFPEAIGEIESAGNCLAIDEGTACVFHLMRALEVVVRRLAGRFQLPVGQDVTWVVLTGNMTNKINTWKKDTPSQKRKKERWSSVVSNLHHVGRATRNPTMHPRNTYNQKQARDVYAAVRVFMVEVAELLGQKKGR